MSCTSVLRSRSGNRQHKPDRRDARTHTDHEIGGHSWPARQSKFEEVSCQALRAGVKSPSGLGVMPNAQDSGSQRCVLAHPAGPVALPHQHPRHLLCPRRQRANHPARSDEQVDLQPGESWGPSARGARTWSRTAVAHAPPSSCSKGLGTGTTYPLPERNPASELGRLVRARSADCDQSSDAARPNGTDRSASLSTSTQVEHSLP
jgi:hypothetical protein